MRHVRGGVAWLASCVSEKDTVRRRIPFRGARSRKIFEMERWWGRYRYSLWPNTKHFFMGRLKREGFNGFVFAEDGWRSRAHGDAAGFSERDSSDV